MGARVDSGGLRASPAQAAHLAHVKALVGRHILVAGNVELRFRG